MKIPVLITCLLFITMRSLSQTIPVGDRFTGDIARRQQVADTVNNPVSFSVQPISINNDTSLARLVAGKNLFPGLKIFSASSSVQLLPFSWLNEYNANRPYGYNNGS